jgi:DNA-binding beta-propeller fold protein YncE
VQSRSGGYRQVAFAGDGTLWALNTGAKRISNSIEIYDAQSGVLTNQVPSGGIYPQALLLDEAGNTLYVADDPSGATEHVDAHRWFALVVSPWAQRQKVSHRDFSGVDRARLGVELWQGARPGEPVPRALLEANDDAD